MKEHGIKPGQSVVIGDVSAIQARLDAALAEIVALESENAEYAAAFDALEQQNAELRKRLTALRIAHAREMLEALEARQVQSADPMAPYVALARNARDAEPDRYAGCECVAVEPDGMVCLYDASVKPVGTWRALVYRYLLNRADASKIIRVDLDALGLDWRDTLRHL